jgi:acyl-CoA synthetase (AMP-forming)/AMP-acid ligase II
VEAALKSHPEVFDALVIGLPDDRLGQSVGALVQPLPGAEIDFAGLEAHLRTQIAGYKVPRSTWVVEEIGRTVSGKADYGWARRHTSSQSAAHRAGGQPAAAAEPAAAAQPRTAGEPAS